VSDESMSGGGEAVDTGSAEGAGEATEQPAAATPTPQPGETAAQAARRWKLQVDGRDEEVDDAGLLAALIETHGEDGVRHISQLSKAARRRMGEVAQQEKLLREAAEDLRDPRRALSLLERIHGKAKARAIMEERYASYLDEDRMTPEQREARDLKGELEQLRAEKQRIESERQEREKATLTQRAQQQIGRQFRDALAAVGETAPTPYQLARMAALAEAQLAETGSIDAADLAREVAREYEGGEVATHVRRLAASPEKLAKVLGPEGMRALRAWDAERVKASQGVPQQQRAAAPPQPRGEAPRRMPVDDFFESLRRKA